MDKIKIKNIYETLEFSVKDRYQLIDGLSELMDGFIKDKSHPWGNLNEITSSIPSMSIRDKWSLWEYDDITSYQLNDEFNQLKEMIEQGVTHFDDLKEVSLFTSMMRRNIGILVEKDEIEQDKKKGSVIVDNKYYKEILKRIKKKGEYTLLNKFGMKSRVTMVDGKLIDSDGDREVISMKMYKDEGNDFFDTKHIVNPVMKKFFESYKDKGFSERMLMDSWNSVGGDLTNQFMGKDMDKVEFDFLPITPPTNTSDFD